MNRITVQRKFESLEKQGLIIRGPKIKRTWSWKADEVAISKLIDKLLRVTNNESNVTESNKISNSDKHYKNPKNINKNILREEESKSDSSPKSDVVLYAFANEIGDELDINDK